MFGELVIYKTKAFARFARTERITDAALADAVGRANRGLIGADLSGGLIKQRIARPGQGRSGGYRTLLAYRRDEWAVFLFGFAKNDRGNIDPHELEALQIIAAQWIGNTDKFAKDVAAGTLIEVDHDTKT